MNVKALKKTIAFLAKIVSTFKKVYVNHSVILVFIKIRKNSSAENALLKTVNNAKKAAERANNV